jgi:nucleotide-binding universal stress UspA family protein
MYKTKLMQVFAVLTIFWASSAIVLAEEELVYPTGSYIRPIVYYPANSVNSVLKPARKSIRAEQATQAIESFPDRWLSLGIPTGLLLFAFYRKKSTSPASIVLQKTSNAPVSLAACRSGMELAAVKPAILKLSVAGLPMVEPILNEEPIAVYATGGYIVVPIDFSAHSAFAVSSALVWKKPEDRVKIVYVCDLENAFLAENLTPSNLSDIHPAFQNIDRETTYHWSQLPWMVVMPIALKIVERWALTEFTRLKQTLPILASKESMEFRVLHGDPVKQIVKFSEDISAKLVVLVTHRHSFTDWLMTGSHAETLLHVSRIPVMVVCEPSASAPSLPQKIVITTDYSLESLQVFAVLKALILGTHPDITVLTVETAHETQPKIPEILAAVEQGFGSLGLRLKNISIEASNVEAGILDYVKAHKPQLVAMSSYGRLSFDPSVTKAVLHEAGIPILVVHGRSIPTMATIGSVSDFLRIITG